VPPSPGNHCVGCSSGGVEHHDTGLGVLNFMGEEIATPPNRTVTLGLMPVRQAYAGLSVSRT
jgi:hypothetical protein